MCGLLGSLIIYLSYKCLGVGQYGPLWISGCKFFGAINKMKGDIKMIVLMLAIDKFKYRGSNLETPIFVLKCILTWLYELHFRCL